MPRFTDFDKEVLKKMAAFLKEVLNSDQYSYDVLIEKFQNFPPGTELFQTIDSYRIRETLTEVVQKLPNHVSNPCYERGSLRDIYALIGNLDPPKQPETASRIIVINRDLSITEIIAIASERKTEISDQKTKEAKWIANNQWLTC